MPRALLLLFLFSVISATLCLGLVHSAWNDLQEGPQTACLKLSKPTRKHIMDGLCIELSATLLHFRSLYMRGELSFHVPMLWRLHAALCLFLDRTWVLLSDWQRYSNTNREVQPLWLSSLFAPASLAAAFSYQVEVNMIELVVWKSWRNCWPVCPQCQSRCPHFPGAMTSRRRAPIIPTQNTCGRTHAVQHKGF